MDDVFNQPVDPLVDGYYWYQFPGGRFEVVHVHGKCQWVKRFYTAEMSITQCRGKFYGPLEAKPKG